MTQKGEYFAHETAVIDAPVQIGKGTKIWHFSHIMPNSEIGEGCNLGQNVFVGSNVKLGNNCTVDGHVVLDGVVEVGDNNQFFRFSSIGAPPQDLTYKGEPTKVVIGDNNIFREYVSIHRGTLKENSITSIGSDCLMMAYVHIAHDCNVNNDITPSNRQ